LEVQGLTKSFGALRAVDEVSFRLAEGGSLGIVGESGSGKTTVARMLVGLDTADSGTVHLSGRDRAAARPRGRRARLAHARGIQMVFQDPYHSLDPRIRVGAGLAEVLHLHEPAADRATRELRVRELLDQVGLGDHEAACLPRHLSGGQRQRVAIARALAARPEVLVLDEAVAALDVSIQAQLLALLADVRATAGIAYLFISHDVAVVRHVADEVMVMYRGRIVEQGPTEQVLGAPRHPYTRLLVASIPRPGWNPDVVIRARREFVESLSTASKEQHP